MLILMIDLCMYVIINRRESALLIFRNQLFHFLSILLFCLIARVMDSCLSQKSCENNFQEGCKQLEAFREQVKAAHDGVEAAAGGSAAGVGQESSKA